MTTFASVCSGIEAASVAFEPFGWHCLWLAEIDKAASAVLAYRYPHVPNLGDLITLADRMTAGEMPPPDVLIGGTPCQAFSIAGLRGGMGDPRGALTMAFVRLVDAIDTRRWLLGWPPVIVVWENVPGVLNHRDNPFGCFLGALSGEDCPLVPAGPRWTNAGYVSGPERAVAWRILDAQYFGLAQRRHRVFVVASAGARFDPAAILFECEGMRRDIAPSRETGKSFTHPIAGSLTSSGRGVARPGDTRGQDPIVACGQITGTKSPGAHPGGFNGQDAYDNKLIALAFGGNDTRGPIDVATARNAHSGPHGRLDFESETFIVEPHCFDARQQDVIQYGATDGPVDTDGYSLGVAFAQNTRNEVRLIAGDGSITGALSAHPGMKQTTYIAFSSKDHGGDAAYEIAPTLRASGHVDSHSNAGAPPAVCVTEPVTHCLRAEGFDASEDGTGRGQPIVNFQSSQSGVRLNDTAGTLDSNYGSRRHNGALVGMAVRRLLPVECERLQGFPDGWTHRGVTKAQADGPRYKQLGNSMAVPVIRWLGQRIDAARA